MNINCKRVKEKLEKNTYELTAMADNSGVMLSVFSGKVVSLNELGAHIIQFLQQQSNNDSESTLQKNLLNELLASYEINQEQVITDLEYFLNQLETEL